MALRHAYDRGGAATLGDAQLVASAAGGDMEAFAELYRRYSDQARRVARRVVDDEDEARDAVAEAFAKVLRTVRDDRAPERIDFAPYLFVVTRNAALDGLRRRARVSPTRDLATLDSTTGLDQAAERTVADEENRLVARALEELPERDQLVLRLLDVEGRTLRAAAGVMALTPNHVAQLAWRARRRLRRGFLQAHVGPGAGKACRFTVEHLSAYLDGDLGRHSRERVEGHLRECPRCEGHLAELRDLGLKLRRALAFPALLGARAHGSWWRGRHLRRGPGHRVTRLAESAPAEAGVTASAPAPLERATHVFAAATDRISDMVATSVPTLQHFVGAASTTVIVVGLAAVGAHDRPSQSRPGPPPARAAVVAAVAAEVQEALTGLPPLSPDRTGAEAAGGAAASSERVAPSGPPAEAGLAPLSPPGLERAGETPAAGRAPATPPRAQAGRPDTGGPTRGGDPGGGSPPPPAVRAPAAVAPPIGTGLDRADETAAAGRAPTGTFEPPVTAGPPQTEDVGRAAETPAADRRP